MVCSNLKESAIFKSVFANDTNTVENVMVWWQLHLSRRTAIKDAVLCVEAGLDYPYRSIPIWAIPWFTVTWSFPPAGPHLCLQSLILISRSPPTKSHHPKTSSKPLKLALGPSVSQPYSCCLQWISFPIPILHLQPLLLSLYWGSLALIPLLCTHLLLPSRHPAYPGASCYC